MPAPIALFQLVSDEAMPNLAAMLALHPARVHHLVTPPVAARSDSLIRVGRQFPNPPEFHRDDLSEMPSIAEVERTLARALRATMSRDMMPVVNFTGGTKLMSIGAWRAAQAAQAVSLYVDTQHACFRDGGTAPGLETLLGGDLSFHRLRATLAVHHIVIANGCPRVTGGRDLEPFAPLARHLLAHPDEETALWEAIHGSRGLCPQGREPRDTAGWRRLLETPLHLPSATAAHAVNAGLLDARNAQVVLVEPEGLRALAIRSAPTPAGDYFRAVRPLQFAISFLSGGWWEVAVGLAVRAHTGFRDLRWSVDTGHKAPGGSVEEDLVAVDGIQLVHISCKRGGQRAGLFRALDEEAATAARLGGRFTRKFLAVYRPIQGRIGDFLRQRAQELRVRILAPADLSSSEAFAA